MRRLFGCPDIVSLTEKFLMARNFFRLFTENNPVMWDSKTFCIPEAKGLRPTKKSPVPGHRLASKSVRWHFFFYSNILVIFCKPVKYVIPVYAVIGTRPNFPYTKYGGLERPRKCSYPYVKMFKTQHGRIQNWHHFIAKKKKTKNADGQVWSDVRRDQRLFWGLISA